MICARQTQRDRETSGLAPACTGQPSLGSGASERMPWETLGGCPGGTWVKQRARSSEMALLGCGEARRPHRPTSPVTQIQQISVWTTLSNHQLILLPSGLQADHLLSSNTFRSPRWELQGSRFLLILSQAMIRILGLGLPALRSTPSGDIKMVHSLHCVWIFASLSLRSPSQFQALLENRGSLFTLLSTDHQRTTELPHRGQHDLNLT